MWKLIRVALTRWRRSQEQRTVESVSQVNCGTDAAKNARSVRHIVNRDCSPLRGARIGVVGHDGAYRYWEWSDAQGRFVPLVLV
jgi:hypothetical protein